MKTDRFASEASAPSYGEIQSWSNIEWKFSSDYFVQDRKSTFNIFQGWYRNK